jgi:FtsP/CotA-like multicopper oxidase with cupredoxin domain
LTLPAFTALPGAVRTRRLSLNEAVSDVLAGVGPRAALLGIVDGSGNPVAMMPEDPVTETPRVNETETWELYNFTEDAHPIHLHQVMFQLIDRQALAADADGVAVAPVQLVGDPLPPDPAETGYKDTVLVYPGHVTRIRVRFDIAGDYVWHCHILEHENNEMMRPLRVLG